MIVLSCNSVCLSYGTNVILDNITFNIQDCDHAGIVGVNGAGKSTLFKIISGILQSDSGDVFISKKLRLGFLEQNSGLDSSNTIWDTVLSTFSDLIEMEDRLKYLEEKISIERHETNLSSYMKEYSLLTEKYSRSGGYEYNSKVKGVLRGLGFEDSEFDRKIHTLSGGQKTRLALVKLLLEEPDILLLDEPTNHLDINSLEWLEDFLKNYKKCVLIISHDRYFLDMVTNKTIELENSQCRVYNGNYTSYMQQKSVDRDIQQKHFDQQQKEIAKMEAFIEQQKRWNREKNIIAAESRQKAIDRIDKVVKPKELPDKIKIKLKSTIISGNDVLFVEKLAKEYPGKTLFKDISFNLKRNEKVFLLGPNGCGKSTILKLLTGRLEKTCGEVEYGHKVKVGYYDQEHEGLNEENCILDEVWNDNDSLTNTHVRNVLASFLFKGEEVFKPISVLSGGEKARVALVKLMLSGSNFLILDEPTNHLDINSREVLEESLLNFDGTILAVSHDRYFINKLATRILELDNESLLDYGGNYSFYIEYKNRIKKDKQSNVVESKSSATKLDFMSNKEEKSRQRKLEKQLNDCEKEISEIESRLSAIQSEMTSETVLCDHIMLTKLHDEQSSLEIKLETLYELWETLASEKNINN